MMNNTDKHNNGSVDHQSDNGYSSTPETIVIINCVLNAPLMLISILSNALVLAAMKRTPSIRSTSINMLCNLAVSDLLVGLIVQPIYVVKELKRRTLLNELAPKIGYFACAASLCTITAITVDRFLALHYHMRYVTLVTKSRVKNALVIIWLLSFLELGFHFWNNRIHDFLSGVVIIICLIICTFSYVRIYLIVRRHQLQIHAQQQAVQSSNAENNLYVLLTLYGISHKDWQTEWEFAITAVFMNSSINPFLYCWRLRELRTAVVKTARQMLCKQTEET